MSKSRADQPQRSAAPRSGPGDPREWRQDGPAGSMPARWPCVARPQCKRAILGAVRRSTRPESQGRRQRARPPRAAPARGTARVARASADLGSADPKANARPPHAPTGGLRIGPARFRAYPVRLGSDSRVLSRSLPRGIHQLDRTSFALSGSRRGTTILGAHRVGSSRLWGVVGADRRRARSIAHPVHANARGIGPCADTGPTIARGVCPRRPRDPRRDPRPVPHP